MKINNSTPTTNPLPSSKAVQINVNWQIGQILQAIVIKAPVAQNATIQINQQQINVMTTAPLVKGQAIEAEVIQVKPEPALKLRSPISPTETNINTALKHALPQQTSLAPLMANLTWLIQSQQILTQLPPPMTEAIKQLINALPQRTELSSSQAIKQAIQNSGLFLENKLAHINRGANPASLAKDLKAALAQLTAQAPKTGMTPSTPPIVNNMAPPPIAAISKIGGDSLMPSLQNAKTTAKNGTAPSTGQAIPAPLIPPSSSQTKPSPMPTLSNALVSMGYLPASTAHALPPLRPVRPQVQSKSAPTLTPISNLLHVMSEITKQSKGSLARINLQQIASTPQADQHTPQWSLELPIRNQEKIDLLQLIITQDEASPGNDDRKTTKTWGIMLSFELENFGPMYVKLTYQQEAISTSIWAEKAESAHLTHAHLKELTRRFKQAGICLGTLHCQQGKPPESAFAGAQQTVLDIRV